MFHKKQPIFFSVKNIGCFLNHQISASVLYPKSYISQALLKAIFPACMLKKSHLFTAYLPKILRWEHSGSAFAEFVEWMKSQSF